MDKRRYYFRWSVMAPIGLVLTGGGLCMAIDAGFAKNSGAPLLEWLSYGTLSLVIFNSGLSVFGGAVINRMRFLMKQKAES